MGTTEFKYGKKQSPDGYWDYTDFVGPCINVASRLQKLGRFSFAFSRRGFRLEKYFGEHRLQQYVLIRSPIRGVGDEELAYVRASEFNLLSVDEKNELAP